MAEVFEKAKTRVLDRIESPRDLLEFKLGAALKRERTVLEMLDRLQDEARTGELKGQLRHHADETRGQVENVEQAFAALGAEADEKPCPVIEAIEKEGRSNVKIAEDGMVARLRQNLEQEQHTLEEVSEGMRERAPAPSPAG